MVKFSNVITKLEEVIMATLMTILAIVMIAAVIFRYFFLNPISWATEVSIYLFIWLSFIGGSWGLKYGLQASVTFLQDALSESKQRILKIIQDAIVLLFLLIILFYAVKWISQPSVMLQKSVSLGMPMWLPYSAVPIGLLFAGIHIMTRLICTIRKKDFVAKQEVEEEML